MRMAMKWPLLAVGAGFFVCASSASADVNVRLEPYVTGVNTPLMMVSAPGRRS